MKITWNKNPFYTTVELDENEKKEFWYKIKIEEMVELLYDAHFHLQDEYLDLSKVKRAVDPEYYDKENEKCDLDKRCDLRLEDYLQELQGCHVGDCTCVPCSCSKCHAESLLGINTKKGLGKHSAHKIDNAFGKDNEKTIDEAIASLANYNPVPNESWKMAKPGEFEQHVPRWTAEAQAAHDWLVKYRDEHFGESHEVQNS